MSVFMAGSEEMMALIVVVMIALPSILLLLCILEESPVSTNKSFEDVPVFCGLFSTADVFGNAMASLICFFFSAIVLFGFAGFAGGWYAVLRGNQIAQPEGTSVSEMTGGYALVQVAAHGLSSFGSIATSGGLSTAASGGIAAFLQPKKQPTPAMPKATAGAPTGSKLAMPKEEAPVVIADGPNGLQVRPLKKKQAPVAGLKP